MVLDRLCNCSCVFALRRAAARHDRLAHEHEPVGQLWSAKFVGPATGKPRNPPPSDLHRNACHQVSFSDSIAGVLLPWTHISQPPLPRALRRSKVGIGERFVAPHLNGDLTGRRSAEVLYFKIHETSQPESGCQQRHPRPSECAERSHDRDYLEQSTPRLRPHSQYLLSSAPGGLSCPCPHSREGE